METNQTENLIQVDEFCFKNNLEVSFINLLQQNGLIEIMIIQQNQYIEIDQLREIEKMIHFYYELNINLEGIETINHLLDRINILQEETIILKNRLLLYEENKE